MGEFLMFVTADDPSRAVDPDIVRPGWLALGLVALICVAVFLLVKSFAKHAKKASKPWEGEDQVSASRDDSTSS